MYFSLDNQWTRNADTIFKYAKEQNKKGNPFPIFCTCLGFQLAAFLTSNYDNNVITDVQGDINIILPIDVVNKNSYLMETFTKNQMDKMTKGSGIMFYSHHYAVRLNTFNTNKYLKEFWNLIATSTTPYN